MFSNWQTVNARGIKPTFFDVTVLPKLPEFQLATTILYYERQCGDATMCGVPFHLIPLEAFPSKSWHQRSFNALCNLFSIVTQGSELAKKWVILVNWFNVWSRDHCAIVIQYVLANPSFLFLCISLLPLKSESNVNVQYELLYTVLNPTFILLLLLTFNPQSRKR